MKKDRIIYRWKTMCSAVVALLAVQYATESTIGSMKSVMADGDLEFD